VQKLFKKKEGSDDDMRPEAGELADFLPLLSVEAHGSCQPAPCCPLGTHGWAIGKWTFTVAIHDDREWETEKGDLAPWFVTSAKAIILPSNEHGW